MVETSIIAVSGYFFLSFSQIGANGCLMLYFSSKVNTMQTASYFYKRLIKNG